MGSYYQNEEVFGLLQIAVSLSIESGQPVEQLLGCASNGPLNTVTARAGTEWSLVS